MNHKVIINEKQMYGLNNNNNQNSNFINNDIDSKDCLVLSYLQHGIPFDHFPYSFISSQLNITNHEVVSILKKAIKLNKVRKVSASINHLLIGYTYNCMLVLNINEENLYKIASFICQFSEVSHCYERKRIINDKINWPYNLFAMIHCKNKEDCESIVEKIIKYYSIKDYLLIYSIKELKKTGVRLWKT